MKDNAESVLRREEEEEVSDKELGGTRGKEDEDRGGRGGSEADGIAGSGRGEFRLLTVLAPEEKLREREAEDKEEEETNGDDPEAGADEAREKETGEIERTVVAGAAEMTKVDDAVDTVPAELRERVEEEVTEEGAVLVLTVDEEAEAKKGADCCD